MIEKYYKSLFSIVKSSCLIRTEDFLYSKNTAILHYVVLYCAKCVFSVSLSLPPPLSPFPPPLFFSLPLPIPFTYPQHNLQLQEFRPHVTPWFQKMCLGGMLLTSSNISYARDFCFIYLWHFVFYLVHLGLPARGRYSWLPFKWNLVSFTEKCLVFFF